MKLISMQFHLSTVEYIYEVNDYISVTFGGIGGIGGNGLTIDMH